MSAAPRTRRLGRGRIDRAIAVLALLSFISQVGVSIMLPLLPLYAVEIGATPGQLGLMVGAFSVDLDDRPARAGVLAARLSGSAPDATRTGGLRRRATSCRDDDVGGPAHRLPGDVGLGGGLTIISERLYIARVDGAGPPRIRQRGGVGGGVVGLRARAAARGGPRAAGPPDAVHRRRLHRHRRRRSPRSRSCRPSARRRAEPGRGGRPAMAGRFR